MKYLDFWLSITILLQFISRSISAPYLERSSILAIIRNGDLDRMNAIIFETPVIIMKFEANLWILALKSFINDPAPTQTRFRILEILWENLQNKNEKDDGLTPLLCTVIFGNERTVKLVVGKSDIDDVDENENTALIHAIRLGFIDVVHILVENGADVNVTNLENETALHFACRLEDPVQRESVIKLLLENWAEVSSLYEPFKLNISKNEYEYDRKKFTNRRLEILNGLNAGKYDDNDENKYKYKLIRNYTMDEILILRLIKDKKMTEELYRMGIALALVAVFFASLSINTFH